MTISRRNFNAAMGLTITAIAAGTARAADPFPSRPIRIIVPFTPGGTTDILARIVSDKLSQNLGTPVIIDNRAGGNTVIGTEAVARAAPDGHTLLLHTNNFSVNPTLYADSLKFDTAKDFAPISLMVDVPHVLVVHPSVPAKDFREFIALAKAKPHTLTFASAGSGTVTHLCGELLKTRAGIDIVHVPYKGSGSVMPDLLGGHVSMQFAGMTTVHEYIRDGRLRALAVTSPKRFRELPDVPTIAEMGYPGYAFSSWFGLLAPANTPAAIVARLNTEVVRAMKDPAVQERLAKANLETIAAGPAEFAAFLKTDIEKSAAIIKASGAKVD